MNEKVCGNPSCSRMIPDSTRAISPTPIAVIAYCTAITLASWLQMYLPMKVLGW